LRQTSATRRRKQRNKGAGYSNLPPYHPDYQGSGAESEGQGEESDSASSVDGAGGRVRRGSEGFEFKPVDREEILKRYLEQLGDTPGRYNRYVPEIESESEDDDVPLGLRAQT